MREASEGPFTAQWPDTKENCSKRQAHMQACKSTGEVVQRARVQQHTEDEADSLQ